MLDFESFYLGTAQRLMRFAYGLTGDLAEAQDFTQGWPISPPRPGNLLLMDAQGVTGHSLANGKSTVLGKPTITGYCSWNTTMLTCPTDKGISVWRYAN